MTPRHHLSKCGPIRYDHRLSDGHAVVNPCHRNEFGNCSRTRTITEGDAHTGDDRQRYGSGHHDGHRSQECHGTGVAGARTRRGHTASVTGDDGRDRGDGAAVVKVHHPHTGCIAALR